MYYKVLHISAATGFYRVERFPIDKVIGPIDVGMNLYDKTGGMTIGVGLLAGSVLPGSNRLVFCGRSPSWGGFYVSTMGGAGLIFENLGLDAIHLTERFASPAALVLNREKSEEVQVRLEPVPLENIWADHNGHIGFYALSHYLWDKHAGEYEQTPRILAVGPAARATDFGAIGSLVPGNDGQLTPVDTWAGRGGFGSKLLRDHNICAVVYGGSFVDEDFRDRKVADVWFERNYSKKMKIKDFEATAKYRYDEAVDTGGTFGVNYAKMADRLLAFNYRTINMTPNERLEIQNRLVRDHYLKQFNKETIEPKKFRTCGEPCAAVCKKMNGPYKKDYEPYHTMGPQIGVFDQRAAEETVHYSDAMGFDAIAIGGIVSWLFELLDVGALTPQEVGLADKPRFSPQNFDPVTDSAHNADLALALMRGIIDGSPSLDLSDGARSQARRLAREHNDERFVDLLVINSFGNRGWMVPNQYWTPGMFSPMAVMGKYYEYYGVEHFPPQKLGKTNAERMIREMMIDNSGFCRFHRLWAEDLIPEIFAELFGEHIDLIAHSRRLAKRITARNMAVPWEGKRTREMVYCFLKRKKEVDGMQDEDLDYWLARYAEQPLAAALDFWYDIHKGVMKELVLDSSESNAE